MRILDFSDGFSSSSAPTSVAFPASLVSVTPSGNLASVDAQSALVELQTDVDTRATSTALNNHISSSTAHAGSAITNTPSGNLAATNVQSALNELQSDIDTRLSALTGDVTASGGGSVVSTIVADAITTTKIINDAVTNAKAANMATQTIKGRTTAGTGDPEDLTATQATAILNAMVGDSGSGGTKGLVPAPGSGDTAAGKFLKADGTWVVPPASTPVYAPPTVQRFTSGSGTYNKNYTFVITSGSATVGATYTNNSVTFTVYATVSSAVQVVMSGSGAPAASGTLTKATGTGDATLSFSQVLSPLYLKVKMAGGGGGGAGGGSAAGTAATDGGNSTFGSSLLTANGGVKATVVSGGTSNGGDGGTVTVSSPAVSVIAVSGGRGNAGSYEATAAIYAAPGSGGTNPFGGNAGSNTASAGNVGITNTGAGGGGGGTTANNGVSGGGGGAGGFIEAIIPSPSATYSYAVGAAGSAGGAGTSGNAGGNGAAGIVIVTEYYQ